MRLGPTTAMIRIATVTAGTIMMAATRANGRVRLRFRPRFRAASGLVPGLALRGRERRSAAPRLRSNLSLVSNGARTSRTSRAAAAAGTDWLAGAMKTNEKPQASERKATMEMTTAADAATMMTTAAKTDGLFATVGRPLMIRAGTLQVHVP